MRHLQPPTPAQHYPQAPGRPPLGPQHQHPYGPAIQGLHRQPPFPMPIQHGPIQHGPVPYPYPFPPHSGSVWAAPAAIPQPPRAGLRDNRVVLGVGAAAAAIAAVVFIAGFWAPGFFVTKQLDVAAVQAGVAHVLADPDGYGAKNVTDVTCNDGHNPTIVKGGTFTCQATIDHIKHQFVVTFTDEAGSYEVSAPKGTKV